MQRPHPVLYKGRGCRILPFLTVFFEKCKACPRHLQRTFVQQIRQSKRAIALGMETVGYLILYPTFLACVVTPLHFPERGRG